jgi:hypothetical protein
MRQPTGGVRPLFLADAGNVTGAHMRSHPQPDQFFVASTLRPWLVAEKTRSVSPIDGAWAASSAVAVVASRTRFEVSQSASGQRQLDPRRVGRGSSRRRGAGCRWRERAGRSERDRPDAVSDLHPWRRVRAAAATRSTCVPATLRPAELGPSARDLAALPTLERPDSTVPVGDRHAAHHRDDDVVGDHVKRVGHHLVGIDAHERSGFGVTAWDP